LSISPPSDIVLDVINAANPARQNLDLQRLQSLAKATKPGAVSFSEALQEKHPDLVSKAKAQPAKTFHAIEVQTAARNNELFAQVRKTDVNSADSQLKKAHRKLESVFLKGIISSMLSAQEGTLYGKGIAGSYWKSFMADAIADQMSKGKGIGIADSFTSQTKQTRVQSANQLTATDGSTDYNSFFQKLFIDELTGTKRS